MGRVRALWLLFFLAVCGLAPFLGVKLDFIHHTPRGAGYKMDRAFGSTTSVSLDPRNEKIWLD